MGADIHICAERKLKDGTWAMCQSYTSLCTKSFGSDKGRKFFRVRDRNYGFFADLAGVRGYGPKPRGMPKDASPLVREECDAWGSDGHSHSWYSAHEFVPIFMKNKLTDEERAELVSDKLTASYDVNLISNVLCDYLAIDLPFDADAPENIRFVFWFDN